MNPNQRVEAWFFIIIGIIAFPIALLKAPSPEIFYLVGTLSVFTLLIVILRKVFKL